MGSSQKVTVSISGYSYEVSDTYGKTHFVDKDKTCSCGKPNCWHVHQVKRYLNAGGERAPEKPVADDTFPYVEDVLSGRHWLATPQTFTPPDNVPVKPGANFVEFYKRAKKIREIKQRMESLPENMCEKAQYWLDLRTLPAVDVCRKWDRPYEFTDSPSE